MQTNQEHIALILFASEQVWPNLLSVAWFHARGGLRKVFIYHTDDELRSGQPARRIQKLCALQFPEVACVLPHAGLPMDPKNVVAQLRAWQQAHAGIARWVVNATGGTKLMFSGAINTLFMEPSPGTRESCTPHWEIIYREQSDGWYALTQSTAGQLQAAQQPEAFIPQDILNDMPILRLISTQYQGSDDITWTQEDGMVYTEITPEKIEGILANGPAQNWHWERLFLQQDLYRCPGSGFAFERFLAAAIHLLGVPPEQIGLNMKAVNRDTGQVQQEIDIVVNKDGRLIVFDCKLLDESREKESFITHLKASHDTARMLGGLGAQCVLVRPNREATDEEKLVAGAWRVKLLGLRESRRLFSELGSILDIAVPPVMRQWERDYLDTGSPRPALVPLPGGALIDTNEAFILDVARMRQQYDAAVCNVQELWSACKMSDSIWVLFDARPPHIARGQVQERLTNAFSSIGEIVGVRPSKQGANWCALIFTRNEPELRHWLAARKGRHLLE